MKRLTALLLVLCLALPLCAHATRTLITAYTEDQWDAVNRLLLSLDALVWTDGIECLATDDRLLYIAMEYNGLMLSGGPDSVYAFMTSEEIADIPAALRFVGAQAHAAQFEAFLEQTAFSPELQQLLSPLSSFFGQQEYSCEEQQAAFIALDEETALTSIIFRQISQPE